MSQNMYTQYETIGKQIEKMLKNISNTRVDLIKPLECFLDKYEYTPLFIVGIDETNMEQIIHDEVSEFRLPFKSILLDFPSKLINNSSNKDYNLSAMVYIETLKQNTYLIEMLEQKTKYEKRSDKFDIESKKINYIHNIQNIVNGVNDCDIVVLSTFIVNIDIFNNKYTIYGNRENIHDCDSKVVNVDEINSFGYPFSKCKTETGVCGNQSFICKCATNQDTKIFEFIVKIINYINNPVNYIVKITKELTPKEVKYKNKKIHRSFNKKPCHIILDHSQVKDLVQINQNNDKHASPLPHHRRGHWRCLKAERYNNKKTIWVRPADINKGMIVRISKSIYEIIN